MSDLILNLRNCVTVNVCMSVLTEDKCCEDIRLGSCELTCPTGCDPWLEGTFWTDLCPTNPKQHLCCVINKNGIYHVISSCNNILKIF